MKTLSVMYLCISPTVVRRRYDASYDVASLVAAGLNEEDDGTARASLDVDVLLYDDGGAGDDDGY